MHIKRASAHKVEALKLRFYVFSDTPILLADRIGIIYFRLFLSIYVSNAIRNEPPKNRRLKTSYVSICPTTPPCSAPSPFPLLPPSLSHHISSRKFVTIFRHKCRIYWDCSFFVVTKKPRTLDFSKDSRPFSYFIPG